MMSPAPRAPRPPAPHSFPLTLSVIVVNWKVRDLLRACLASLYPGTQLDPARWEVIVVDNASGDGSPEMVRAEFPQAVLQVHSVNLGFGKANNEALPLCRGEYLLLLNPDTVVPAGTVDRMLEIMAAREEIGALGCRLRSPDGTVQRFTGGYAPGVLNVASYYLFAHRVLPPRLLPPPLFLDENQEPREDTAVGWVSGACMLLRRAALGGTLFDERFFMYGEDLELCRRLAADGWQIVYTPRASIVHHGGRSLELQSPGLRSRNLMGLREVYMRRPGFSSARLFDFVMFLAFLLRVFVFGLAARARPGRGFDARAAASRHLLGESLRLLLGLRNQTG